MERFSRTTVHKNNYRSILSLPPTPSLTTRNTVGAHWTRVRLLKAGARGAGNPCLPPRHLSPVTSPGDTVKERELGTDFDFFSIHESPLPRWFIGEPWESPPPTRPTIYLPPPCDIFGMHLFNRSLFFSQRFPPRYQSHHSTFLLVGPTVSCILKPQIVVGDVSMF